MICKTCGKELSEIDNFCPQCGAKIERIQPSIYEEVVFNPPFKIENEMKEKEILDVEPRAPRKFDTMDFAWDLSGYPSQDEKPKKTEEVVFDWTKVEVGASKDPVEELFNEVEKLGTMEMPAIRFEEEEPVKVEAEEYNPVPPEVDLTAMPEGKGITVDDFLEELKHHVPKSEREEEVVEKPTIKEQVITKAQEGTKGLRSFFRETFIETPVPVEVEEERPLEYVGCVRTGARTLEVMAFDPVIESIKNQEINEFLPENQQEDEGLDPGLDATRIVDKFYTFNQKNVQFQELLDKEYERIRGDRPIEELKEEVKKSNQEASNIAKEVLELKEQGKIREGKQHDLDEIFKEEEEEPVKKSKAGKVAAIILLIIVLVLGAGYALKEFMPDTQLGQKASELYDKALSLIAGEEEEVIITDETVQTYIKRQKSVNEHIQRISYDQELAIDVNRDYGVKVKDTERFVNSQCGDTTYGDMITAAIIKHYSQMASKEKDQKMELLQIGDFRTSDHGYYVIVSYRISDENSGDTYNSTELLRLAADGDKIVIETINKI
ncbi:MAG: zinc ribbon domain-containing protein [Clostridia bacterium]|nr:zinc ribbon domain-containing protein [Clostridia bacterium]